MVGAVDGSSPVSAAAARGSALAVPVPAGPCTALVSGGAGATGEPLVEICELPPRAPAAGRFAFCLACPAASRDTKRCRTLAARLPMKSFSLWRSFVWSGLLACLAGCATLAPGPTVGLSVVNLRPLQSTVLETGLELTLRLTNESAQPLVLAGSTHKLYLNDSYVGRAVSNERVTVPAFGTATPAVTVYLENLTLLRKAAEFAQAPQLAYRLDSRLHPADGAAFGDVRARASGELDLAGLGLTPPPAGR